MAQAGDGIDQFNMTEMTYLADRIETLPTQMVQTETETQI